MVFSSYMIKAIDATTSWLPFGKHGNLGPVPERTGRPKKASYQPTLAAPSTTFPSDPRSFTTTPTFAGSSTISYQPVQYSQILPQHHINRHSQILAQFHINRHPQVLAQHQILCHGWTAPRPRALHLNLTAVLYLRLSEPTISFARMMPIRRAFTQV